MDFTRRTMFAASAVAPLAASSPAERNVSGSVYFATDFGVDPLAADNTAAMNAFCAAVAAGDGDDGGVEGILPAGRIVCTGPVLWDGGGTIRGVGPKETILHFATGSGWTWGTDQAQTKDYNLTDAGVTGDQGVTAIWVRWVRGFYFERFHAKCDRFILAGDVAAGVGKPCYIGHFIDGRDCGHPPPSLYVPTLNFIDIVNCQGQWIEDDFFIEGRYHPSLDGWTMGGNIQDRLDHVVFSGGYIGRFRDNRSLVDGRVNHMHVDDTHHNELALRQSYRFEVTASTAKSTSQVGWSGVNLGGKVSSTGSNAILFKCARHNVGVTAVKSGALMIGSEQTRTPIRIEGIAGQMTGFAFGPITWDNVVPIDNQQSVIELLGDAASTTIVGFAHGPIVGRAFTNPLASVIKVKDRCTSIALDPDAMGFHNALQLVDDQSSAATPLKLATPASSQLATYNGRLVTGGVLARAFENFVTRNGSVLYDPPPLAPGEGVTTMVLCASCALGDFAAASFAADLQGLTVTAYVSAPGIVSVRFQNGTGATVDLGSATLRVRTRPASLT